jgi:hypothetical protein
MKLVIKILGICVLCYVMFAVWFVVASDFGDSVVIGTYHLAGNGETSTLVLKRDHTFAQRLTRGGKVQDAKGTWRSISSFGGIAFSMDFLPVRGEEPGGNGLTYAHLKKILGIYPVKLLLTTYDVEWYGRLDPNSGDPVAGSYAGDEERVQSSLVLRANRTFEQTVSFKGVTKHASGAWNFNSKGDIEFSREFIKSTGDALSADETATAWNPKGAPLQIEIDAASRLKEPVYWKWQMPW